MKRWGVGPAAVSDRTLKAGVGCGQVVYTKDGELRACDPAQGAEMRLQAV